MKISPTSQIEKKKICYYKT